MVFPTKGIAREFELENGAPIRTVVEYGSYVNDAIWDPKTEWYYLLGEKLQIYSRNWHLEKSFDDLSTRLGFRPYSIAILKAPLIANAGLDQNVDEGGPVNLDGSGSANSSPGPSAYTWTQIAGPGVVLSAADTATPSFTAPYVTPSTTLTFSLTVSDENRNKRARYRRHHSCKHK